MSTASTILLLRLQTTGENVNTWGGYLNTAMQMIEQASKGYQALAVTGDATISWTNYTTGNSGECGFLKLTGTLTSAATLTFPSNQNLLVVKNAAGATVTIKIAAGTGVAIPNGRTTLIACDGTDYIDVTASWLSTSTTLTNANDIPTYTQVQTLIANAAIPAAAGTILASASDTTAGYAGTKIVGSGAASVAVTGSGNLSITISVGSLGLTAGTAQTVGFTAAVNTKYVCNFTAASTVTLPASATAGDVICLALGGGVSVTLNPNGLKLNASTATLGIGTDMQTILLTYLGATNGWV